MRQKWRNHGLTALLLVLMVSFAGCTTVAYKVPIGNYKDANSLVIENTRMIIQQANQVERENYIDKQVIKHSEIRMSSVHEAELFTEDQLAARMKALDTIDAYGTLLLKIVNSDSPKSIAESSGTIAKDVDNLAGMIAKLQGANDAEFKNAADPLMKIVSQVVGYAMEQKIREALDKAIKSGYEPMNKLITALDREPMVLTSESGAKSIGNWRTWYMTTTRR